MISKVCFFIGLLFLIYFYETATGRLRYFSITFLSAIVITLLAYTFLRNKIYPKIFEINYLEFNHIQIKSTLTLFLLWYSASIYLLYTQLYYRPFIYFTIIVFLCILVLIQIYSVCTNSSLSAIILLEILLISINIKFGIIYEFTEIIGVDPIYHLNLAMNIVNTGFIPNGLQYSAHPIMHILISVTKIISDIGNKNSLIFSIGFLVAILPPLFIFVTCNKIFTTQIALISSLFVSICNYLIWYGYMLFVTSLGIVYLCILLYFLISHNLKHSISKTLLIVSYFIIVLLHPLTNMVCLFVVALFVLISTFYLNKNDRNCKIIFKNNILLLFIILTLGYWIYSSTSPGGGFFFDFVVSTVFQKLRMEHSPESVIETPESVIETPESVIETSLSNVSGANEIINMVGVVPIFCFAVLGFLHTIRVKKNNNVTLSFVFIGFAIFTFAAVCQVFGFENILPERWFAFAYLLFSIPAALGFQIINFSGCNKNILIIVQLFAIIIISFFMITSSIANMDSPLYSKDISLRIGMYDSEINALNTLLIHSDSAVITDMRHISMKSCTSNKTLKYFTSNFRFDMLTENDLVIVRNYVRNNRIDVPLMSAGGGAPAVLSKDFLRTLESKYAIKIYDNRVVDAYLIV